MKYPEIPLGLAPIPTFRTGEFELGYKSPDYGTLTGWRGGNPLFESTPDNPNDDLSEVDIRDFGKKFRELNPIAKPTGQARSTYSILQSGPPIPQTVLPPAPQSQVQSQAAAAPTGFGGVEIPTLSQNVGMNNNPMASMFPNGWQNLGDNYASLFGGSV